MRILEQLSAGQSVEIRGQLGVDKQFEALEIRIKEDDGHDEWEGKLQDVSAENFQIKLLNQRVVLSTETKMINGKRKPITINDLTPGSIVKVKGKFRGDYLQAEKLRSIDMPDVYYDIVQGKIAAVEAAENIVKVAGFNVNTSESTKLEQLTGLAFLADEDLDLKTLNPVVIGCSGGSGSRLIREILAACPEIFMDRDCNPLNKDSHKSKNFLKKKNPPEIDFRGFFNAFMSSVVDQVPDNQFDTYAYFGWKNPENLPHVDQFLTQYPALKFIHLVRHPAAMAGGRQQQKVFKKNFRAGNVPEGMNRTDWILKHWVQRNVSVWEKHHENPNYHLIRYEEVLFQPQKTLQALFQWLNLNEANLKKVVSLIQPPKDATSRGDGVNISIIADEAAKVGYKNEASNVSSI